MRHGNTRCGAFGRSVDILIEDCSFERIQRHSEHNGGPSGEDLENFPKPSPTCLIKAAYNQDHWQSRSPNRTAHHDISQLLDRSRLSRARADRRERRLHPAQPRQEGPRGSAPCRGWARHILTSDELPRRRAAPELHCHWRGFHRGFTKSR